MKDPKRESRSEKSARQRAAEDAFGTEFASFDPIGAGNSSANYRAVAADGTPYFVKFASPSAIEAAVARTRAACSPLVPRLAFGGASGACGGLRFCALEWLSRGKSADPAVMSPAQIAALPAAYAAFSSALQRAAGLARDPGDLDPAAFGSAPRAIHGDMHFRNVFFDGDEVVAFFDLEKMRLGYPAEDLLRYFAHALERTRFWRVSRTRAILRALGEVARISGLSRREWTAAAELYRRRKAAHRARKTRLPAVLKRIEAFLREPLYARIRRAVGSAPSSAEVAE